MAQSVSGYKMKKRSKKVVQQEDQEIWRLRLYVTGTSPKSQRVVETVRAICKDVLRDRYELVVLDMLANPMMAVNDRITTTPTLFKIYPHPSVKVKGDLSDREYVLRSLGLK